MGIFKKNRNKNGHRGYVFFIVVIVVGLICAAINGIRNRSEVKRSTAEKTMLEAFDKWAEENDVDSLLGRSVVKVVPISDYKTYVDGGYFPARRRLDMLQGVQELLGADDGMKKNEMKKTERWLAALEATADTSSYGTDLAVKLERERLDWYRKIASGNLAEVTARLESAIDSVRNDIKGMETSAGYKILFVCMDKDSLEYNLSFVSPQEKPDSLILFGVVPKK